MYDELKMAYASWLLFFFFLNIVLSFLGCYGNDMVKKICYIF